MFSNIVSVIDVLSELGKVVDDLKPDNVFVVDGNGVVDVSYLNSHRPDFWKPTPVLHKICAPCMTFVYQYL